MATVEKNFVQESLKTSGTRSAYFQAHQENALIHLETARRLARQSTILALEIEIAVETVEVILMLADRDQNRLAVAKKVAAKAERLLIISWPKQLSDVDRL